MCNPFKAIKKVFKKVVKVVKKVLPVALAAVAIYFTVGAALGVPGTAGGWGGAVSGVVGKLGLGSTLSSVLTGAVTQAGYGAVLGGGLAAVTGGDVSRGLLSGATAGAVTGGVLGGLGQPTDPLKGIGEAPATAASSGVTGAGATVPSTASVGVSTAADLAASSGGGLLSKAGGFIKDNPIAAGLAIQGLGTGISGFAQAKAESDIAKDEASRIAANFGVGEGGGLLTGSAPDTIQRPTPTQQFNPATELAKTRGQMWRYNPATGQIELT